MQDNPSVLMYQQVEQLTAVLQEWCEATGRRWALIGVCPLGAACSSGVRGKTRTGGYTMHVPRTPCALTAADVIAAAGDTAVPSPGVSLCLMSGLPTGQGIVVKTDCTKAVPGNTHGVTEQARLLAPLLMWAREAWEREHLQRRLDEVAESLREHLRASLQAQEEEREWLMMEIHDRLAQTLAAVFQQLQKVETLAGSSPEIRQAAIRGSLLSMAAIREARSLMKDLCPPLLEELGLLPLVQEELRGLEQETGCQIRESLSYPVRASPEGEVALYRIFHEALINVRRHAQATQVHVALRGDQAAVRLEVADNGRGFDVPQALGRKRVGGLMIMRRRAELAGGWCSIESAPGQGTRVTAQAPLAVNETLAAVPFVSAGRYHTVNGVA